MSLFKRKSDRLAELALVQGPVLFIIHASSTDAGVPQLKELIVREYSHIIRCEIIQLQELPEKDSSFVLGFKSVVSMYPSIDDFRNDIIASFVGMLGEFVVTGRSYASVFPQWPVLLRATRKDLAAHFVHSAYLTEMSFKTAHAMHSKGLPVSVKFGGVMEMVDPFLREWIVRLSDVPSTLDGFAYSSSKHRRFISEVIIDMLQRKYDSAAVLPAQCHHVSPVVKFTRNLAGGIDVSGILEASLSCILPSFIINRLNNDTNS